MSLNSDILTFNININSNLVVKSLSGNLILSRFFYQNLILMQVDSSHGKAVSYSKIEYI